MTKVVNIVNFKRRKLDKQNLEKLLILLNVFIKELYKYKKYYGIREIIGTITEKKQLLKEYYDQIKN